ncbi:MAG TPA: 3-ketoacyl-ACP reductase [Oscillospiraceae bacterium]|nr:3-ketoacyl-ACP reductase [Oscillospiraceae bacterium]HPS34124.1 3-ketoacyl-ACP reductase [Oscillospiraceae bacterium]
MRIALVTGSSRGIGLGILKALKKDGYFTIMSSTGYNDRVSAALKELDNCAYLSCDISDSSSRKALFEQIEKEYGRLDVLVNNAGAAPKVRADLLEVGEESYDFVVGTNQKGTFFVTQAAANLMIDGMKKGITDYRPRIVNISSISAYTSSVSRAPYCISKAGVSMITKLFADRLAEFGIPVFEVRPGIIDTDMTAGESTHRKYDGLIRNGLLPTARWGTPDDVGDAVSVLCSGKLDYSTGQVIEADGGFHLRRL